MSELIIISFLLLLTPVFFVFGALLDPVMRCKFLRALTRKNYGIVYLLGRDGKQLLKLIKNFDKDIIQFKNAIWIIEPGKIYNEKEATVYPIEPEKVKYVAGIPVLFLDWNTFKPLSFENEKTKATPEEIFAPISAWIITKEAELLRWKRTTQIALVILIVCLAIAIYYSFDTHEIVVKEILPAVRELKNVTVSMPAQTQIITQGG